jgi:hypothetical protein
MTPAHAHASIQDGRQVGSVTYQTRVSRSENLQEAHATPSARFWCLLLQQRHSQSPASASSA